MQKVFSIIMISLIICGCGFFGFGHTDYDTDIYRATTKIEVMRIHEVDMMPQAGDLITIVPNNTQKDSLEFKDYHKIVVANLEALGYSYTNNVKNARYIVNIVYGIEGQEYLASKTSSDSVYVSPSYDYSTNSFSQGMFIDVPVTKTYTDSRYIKYLFLVITDSKTNERVFEATSKYKNGQDNFFKYSKCLIDAVFEDFPGENGYGDVKLYNDECIR